ncbi:MAG: Mu transposase C-terminal domain-containing protein, partial [Burkholderiaceae bacterium]|nr:Mu transposase C-terminal domain-containing protein [Burkholderiaceae bacterium]
ALPADMNLLEVLCTELEVRTVFHYGIEICGERTFNSPGLQEIRRRRQLEDYIKVKVRYRPARLDRIWVYDDAQEVWMEVMNSNPETRDLSEFQLKMLHKLQREEAVRGDTVSIVEARGRMKSLVEPLLRAKTQRARKRALKMLGWTTDTNVLAPSDTKPDRGMYGASAAGSPDTLRPSPSAPDVAPKAKRSSTKRSVKQADVSDTAVLPVFPNQPAVDASSGRPDGRNEVSFEGELLVFPTSPLPTTFGGRV